MLADIKEYKIKDRKYYLIDGKIYPSVTTIISILEKPRIIDWAVRETINFLKNYENSILTSFLLERAKNRYIYLKEKAQERGDKIHRAIQRYIMENKFYTELNAIANFIEWQNKTQFKCYEVEKLVISHRFRYAGRIDLFGKIKNNYCIIDIKTSKKIWTSHLLQVSAYRFASKVNARIGILRLTNKIKDLEEYWLTEKDYNRYLQVFLYLTKIYHFLYLNKDYQILLRK